MTVKELYEMAKEKHMEDAQLVLDYACNDCWYNYCEIINKNEINFTESVIISIEA